MTGANQGSQGEIDLGKRLTANALWLFSFLVVALAISFWQRLGFGVDSHAYWGAWHGEMYEGGPNTLDAFLYSPAFAQATWPFVQLGWPAFGIIWLIAQMAAIAWLLHGVKWYLAVPLWLCCAQELVSGNINWLLALVAVVGVRHAGLWVLPALTKITPCLGPVWFLARGEWRHLLVFLGTFVGVVAVSGALAPGLWREWADFLLLHADSASDAVGWSFVPPTVLRLPVAIVLTVWAARTNRPWWLPVAMYIASPVAGIGAVAILMAIPRLRREGDSRGRAVTPTSPAD